MNKFYRKFVFFILIFPTLALGNPPLADADSKAKEIVKTNTKKDRMGGAFLKKRSGTVEVRKMGQSAWIVVDKEPVEIGNGSRVKTGEKSKAELAMERPAKGSLLMVDANADFMLQKPAADVAQFRLNQGTFDFNVGADDNEHFVFGTTHLNGGIRTTGERTLFRVEADLNTTIVSVEKGLVWFSGPDGGVLVKAGEFLEASGEGLGQPKKQQAPKN